MVVGVCGGRSSSNNKSSNGSSKSCLVGDMMSGGCWVVVWLWVSG